MTARRTASGLLLGAVLAWTFTASSGSMLVPPRTQAGILKKMLAYDRALAKGAKLILIGSERDPAMAQELTAAFEEVGFFVDRSRPEELGAKLGDGSVVYLMTGVPSARVKRLCVEKGVLSISGFPGLAESGDVSVAVGLRADGKPQIVVHRGQLRAEGHEFADELLKLTKLVG